MPPKKPQVPAAVEAAISGDLGEARVADIVDHFMRLAGGPTAIARMMYDVYSDKDATAMTKQRIMDTVLKGLKFREEMRGPREPDALATDADLVREAVRLLRRAAEEDARDAEARNA